jgi:ABC-type branched-subunit amino acid transport system substrate-binding protein
MTKIKWVTTICLFVMLVALPAFSTAASPEKTVYIGGAFALTSPFAEDSMAVLNGFQVYAQWVNDHHITAPWYPDRKFPTNIKLETIWQDDQYQATNVLPVYEALRDKGALVYRNSGTAPQVLAPRLMQDRVGATSMSCEPFLLQPPKTIFTIFPTFADCVVADAEWFLTQWKEKRKPRYAFLTGDNDAGRSVITPEVKDFMKKLGFDFAGSAFVPFVPTSPPTTQLLWLKQQKVDLAIGMMIRAGAEPTTKEAVRLGMGPHLGYKIVFGYNYPVALSPFSRDMGELGDGVIVGGDLPDWADTNLKGMRFVIDMMKAYKPKDYADYEKACIGYTHGVAEAMIQVEALRLTSLKVPLDQVKDPKTILENGFWKIKDLDTGGIRPTPLTFGPKKVEGLSGINVAQVQHGKRVQLGVFPIRMLLPK